MRISLINIVWNQIPTVKTSTMLLSCHRVRYMQTRKLFPFRNKHAISELYINGKWQNVKYVSSVPLVRYLIVCIIHDLLPIKSLSDMLNSDISMDIDSWDRETTTWTIMLIDRNPKVTYKAKHSKTLAKHIITQRVITKLSRLQGGTLNHIRLKTNTPPPQSNFLS